MRRFLALSAMLVTVTLSTGSAQQSSIGPYKVLKSARVGGEGGWDYITSDTAGRRIYIPRRGVAGAPATDTRPAVTAIPTRLSIYDLDTLALISEIDGVGGNGAVVDPKSGNGFTSSRPVAMFDTKTMKLVKTIDTGKQGDGILFDSFNQRVYVFNHPTKDASVIDAKDGTLLGAVDLGGVPEEAVADSAGMVYVVMQDAEGGVTAVDGKTMKATAHWPFGNAGSCNGLALDAKNKVLFAACARSGNPLEGKPMMIVMSAVDGKILANLPLAGNSDGAAFNPATMEAFSTHGNGTLTIVKEVSPTKFEVEQNLETMNGARTIAFDSKTNHILTMSVERGPAPPPPPGGGRGQPGAVVPGSFTILVIGK